MKKALMIAAGSLLMTSLCFASNPYTPTNQSKKPIPVNTAVTNWMSPNSMSTYYIQTGSSMSITIRVNNNGAGVKLSNCAMGGVAAGAGTVCNVMNTRMPVGITSTSQTASASGTYQIRPR